MDSTKKHLLIHNKLLDGFCNAGELSSGYIAGWDSDESIFCLASSYSKDYFLPGLEVIGIYCLIDDPFLNDNAHINISEKNIDLLKVELENPIVLFAFKDGDSIKLTAKIFNLYYRSISDIDFTITSDNPFLLLRAKGKIPFLFEIADPETIKENIEFGFEKLRATITSQIPAFLLRDSSFILSNNFNELDSSVTCGNLFKYIEDSDLAESIKKNIRSSKRKVPINFDILMQTSGDAALENTVSHSLVIHCQRREYQCISLSLPVDVIIICKESCTGYDIYNKFLKGIQQQLQKMSECLLKYAKNSDFVCPVPYHFYPDSWSIPITVVYPSSKTDDELVSFRRNLHKLLLLPIDRPLIKKLNKYEFSTSDCPYLINPHEGLPPSGIVDGKTSIVYGRYAYHHYMQDRMNDNGWGCAYRSLQTIISWFKFQGYTDINIPSHTEIQQALVDIGDKPQSFVGSKKWIGSQEVSFCLNHLIQIDSKIMCVSSGAEMASKGRELYLHFKDQGTPVMIGGGVLAHTILGVDFNQNTGDLKFLILDPHYTGGEDLHIVQSKGWCGWKGVSFWDQNAFYNLCLPQRSIQM